MEPEVLWQAFAETGEPGCYMLYRAIERRRETDSRKTDKDPGETPRAEG